MALARNVYVQRQWFPKYLLAYGRRALLIYLGYEARKYEDLRKGCDPLYRRKR